MNYTIFRTLCGFFCVMLLITMPCFADQIFSLLPSGGYYPGNSETPPIVLQNGYNSGNLNPAATGSSPYSATGPAIWQKARTSPATPSPSPDVQSPESARIMVKYRNSPSDIDTTAVSSLHTDITGTFGASVLPGSQPVQSAGFQILTVPGTSIDSVIDAYQGSSLVEYAEPDFRISLEPSETGISIITPSSGAPSPVIPDDPDYGIVWGLHNTGQPPFNGTPGADISAEEAWQYATGSKEIVVAVLDSGVDYTHDDLAANIWINEGEIPDNLVDDDGNGYVDDVHGWNFQGNNNNVLDDNGHGTHCAGIIGAVGNNRLGITGVNWNVRIMPLKFMDNSGNGNISDAISGFLYANRMGADVISCSWSGTQFSHALQDVITASSAVVVCAAGNNGSDDDTTPVYPAAFPCPNIIAVAATDASDSLASFSNYGKNSVDIGAPGVEIASTYPGNLYAYMSGTSMATPFVSGAAALLKSVSHSQSGTEIRNALLASADPLPSLERKVTSQGRLNTVRALSQRMGRYPVSQTPVPAPSPSPDPANPVFTLYPSSP